MAVTIEDVRAWPATVSVPKAAEAFGISKSHAYELARTGQFPARILKVGGSVRVVTASILRALEAG